MDAQVLKAQRWVNKTYANRPGYSRFKAPENGITGLSTLWALLLGLQYELGISKPLAKVSTPTFGPDTARLFVAKVGNVNAKTHNRNLRIVVEAALYCKGYSGGALDGSFGRQTRSSVVTVKRDLGFSSPSAGVYVKQLKALLTMDSYTLLSGGSRTVRSVQQWLNRTYSDSAAHFDLVPCDGYCSAAVANGLLIAVQRSIGLASADANGSFGPATTKLLHAHAGQKLGSKDYGTSRLVTLFKAALVLDGRSGVDWGNANFTRTTVRAATALQAFVALPQTGSADYPTWCSLLISYGDNTRPAKAADCSTPLDAARVAALSAAGVTTVGRYLTGTVGTTSKALTKAELQVMAARRLHFFCIMQDGNRAISAFTKANGQHQAKQAHAAAVKLGIPKGAVIYFAVDTDVSSSTLTAVTNYFRGVHAELAALGGRYRAGVYGPRFVCSSMAAAKLTVSSFVADLSYGWAYNRGYPLPKDWAFDQFAEGAVGSGASRLGIDHCAMSGRYRGINAATI